ncbi:MAG TPA: hypothetical protein PLM16_00995 [Candidatus Woesebacteria bacterium]|nr:hypothetical protein [Candidatus Woesebacteria bacterium]
MKNFRLFWLFLILTMIASLVIPFNQVQAVCPVCTIAVGAGLGISRWLGIDDLISGLWIGGLVTSSGMWFVSWLKNKYHYSKWSLFLAGSSFHLLLIPTLYLLNITGDPANVWWGVDKIIAGIIMGTIIFFLATKIDRWLRRLNQDRVFVYYQKVIIPMLLLSIMSFIVQLFVN